jgi:hypothetical protein
MRKLKNLLYFSLLIAACHVFGGFCVPGTAEAQVLSQGQTVYVPIYSHVYSGDRERPFLLAAILSIRNTDLKHGITVLAADYYDTEGNPVRKYLEKPVRLGPLASLRYVVGESDKSGGSGAKFIVRWQSDVQVNAPIVEGVMIGTQLGQGISFVSRGQVISPAGN